MWIVDPYNLVTGLGTPVAKLTMGVGGVGQGYTPSAGDLVSVVSQQASTRQAARVESKAIGRSFAERTTTIAAADAEASAAVDQVLGTLETDSDAGGSVIDDLAVDLLLPQTRRSHGGRAMK